MEQAAEPVLRQHPGVREAAVATIEAGLVAFVVPDDAYVDGVLGRRNAEATVLNRWQKTYDLNQSTPAAIAAPRGFNTVGWDSSYTRQPIPTEEMREWVQTSVNSILQLGPQRVYEIGCGTGMLLTRIAPRCERYVAVDFSREVLRRVREQLDSMPDVAERVELMERRADNFEGLESNSFDTVVINSAAQYFPHVAYLTQVLEQAVRVVRPGGRVFVGDVRSFPLLPAFTVSVELYQAAEAMELAELRERVRRRLRHMPELVLSPAYFLALQQRMPRVSGVEISLRGGREDNEMTRYRYNAVLHVGEDGEPGEEIPFREWTRAEGSVDGMHELLRRESGAFGLRGIPNARIAEDVLAARLLWQGEASRTAESLRREIREAECEGIHPEDVLDLGGAGSDFAVQLSWAASRADGSYDALFVPKGVAEHRSGRAVRWPQPEARDFVRVANAPGQAKVRAELIEQLLAHCRTSLPGSRVPDAILLVDAIPAGGDEAAAAWARLQEAGSA